MWQSWGLFHFWNEEVWRSAQFIHVFPGSKQLNKHLSFQMRKSFCTCVKGSGSLFECKWNKKEGLDPAWTWHDPPVLRLPLACLFLIPNYCVSFLDSVLMHLSLLYEEVPSCINAGEYVPVCCFDIVENQHRIYHPFPLKHSQKLGCWIWMI